MGQPKTIFLTGGNGFIGRNIIEQLGGTYTIYAPSRSELDLLDSNAVYTYLQKCPVDFVIHAANIGGKRNSIDTGDWEEKNMTMFQNIVVAKQYFSRMIVLGSGAEYDKRYPIIMAKEDDALIAEPIDPYGRYKKKCSEFASTHDFITHLRLFGIFGPYEDYRVRFISNNICRVLLNLPILIKRNVMFDYLYIDDFIQILAILLEKEILEYAHYNVCTGSSIDLITLANYIKDISQKNVEVQVKQDGLNKEYSGENCRLMKELQGFEFTNIKKSIEHLYRWYEERIHIIDKEAVQFDS